MVSTKQLAREIFQRTLDSIDIPEVMQRKLSITRDGRRLILTEASVDLSLVSRIVIVAIGKAAHAMVTGLVSLFPAGTFFTGVVSAPVKPPAPVPGLQYFLAGHPNPNRDSWRAAEAILSNLQSADDGTLVFFLLSGGGSALVELPLVPGMTLEDLQAVNHALVTCGAPIHEMNTVRRHFSAIKGGRLAVAANEATKITLAVTDVPAGKEAALASGPSLPDPTTVEDVQRILRDYDLAKRFPALVREWHEAGQIPETPKHDHAAFSNSHFELLLGLDDLFHAAHHAVEAHGYLACCDNSTDDWPVEKAVAYLLDQLDGLQRENPGQRVAVIADGEVSSPVTGHGVGGRNSAFVLACVERIAGRKITVLSAGTDGIDGNSPAAGAVADGETLVRAKAAGLDAVTAFRESDAYTFFSKLEDAIVTGPTGNNLRDLRILLGEPA
jgi:glycerate 2-kinase